MGDTVYWGVLTGINVGIFSLNLVVIGASVITKTFGGLPFSIAALLISGVVATLGVLALTGKLFDTAAHQTARGE